MTSDTGHKTIRPGIDRQWTDIQLSPEIVFRLDGAEWPTANSGEVYGYTTADDTGNAVIGVDRENGYRFMLDVGIDGIDVEIRRTGDRSLAGALIKSNRKAVYYI